VLGALAVPMVAAFGASGEPVRVFAAATLKDALDAMMVAIAAMLDAKVIGVYGPSSALVGQLDDGAPSDVFFSADPDWMKNPPRRRTALRPDRRASRAGRCRECFHRQG
jgi:molybdate transport system substrate-binding protein